MSEFVVTIKHRRGTETYRVYSRQHDDTATDAVGKALRSFETHGHGTFPYNRGPLEIAVEERKS